VLHNYYRSTPHSELSLFLTDNHLIFSYHRIMSSHPNSTAEENKKRGNDVDLASTEGSRPGKQAKRDEEPLIFDKLINDVEYDKDDKSTVWSCHKGSSTAISNFVMTSGKHYVTFERAGCEANLVHAGVMRPVAGHKNGEFHPLYDNHYKLINKTPERWGDGKVHVCMRELCSGKRMDPNGPSLSLWSDGRSTFETKKNRRESMPEWGEWEGTEEEIVKFGMLLDLDAGTLTLFDDKGKSLGILKEGLTGEYCWAASIVDIADGTSVHIMRGAIKGN